MGKETRGTNWDDDKKKRRNVDLICKRLGTIDCVKRRMKMVNTKREIDSGGGYREAEEKEEEGESIGARRETHERWRDKEGEVDMTR